MRTIFIPIFSGIEGKNILRSDICKTLHAAPDVRLVFFVKSEERAAYYRREPALADTRIIFEVVRKRSLSWSDRIFSFLKFYLLRSHTIDLKRATHYKETGNPFRFAASFLANRLLARPPVRRFVRALDLRFTRNGLFVPHFDRYRPDLVFLADLFDDTEAAMLREAKRRGVFSVGLVSTWDRTTSRWMVRLLPDEFIVFNELMRNELVEYCDMPRERIRVSGAVQYDRHLAAPPALREAFARKLGIGADQPIILYGPLGRTFDRSAQSDREMVALLNRFVEEGTCLPRNAVVVVRFPPNDFVDPKTLPPHPHILYEIPGVRFGTTRGQDWDFSADELDHLRDLLFHSALVITYYSSLSLDAAVFDKPVINVNFDFFDESKRHPYYETTHYSKVAAVGGIRLVQSKRELCEWIGRYLSDPSIDRDARRRLIAMQAWKLDGRSGERVGRMLLSYLAATKRRQDGSGRESRKSVRI